MAGKVSIKIDDPDEPPSRPPPPPPKRLSRPKITISMPEATLRGSATAQAPVTPRGGQTPQIYWGPMKYHGRAPTTPGSVSNPHEHPYFMHMYHNKASEFMFKQFEGFKDFTMNTAKSGLSAGEKSAFWFYNKLRTLSKRWFTHFFLTLCLILYSVLGAFIFMALEGAQEKNSTVINITEVRSDIAVLIYDIVKEEGGPKVSDHPDTVSIIEDLLKDYAGNYTECQKQHCDSDKPKKTWGFWNAMFYAGTIYTTIGKTCSVICYTRCKGQLPAN